MADRYHRWAIRLEYIHGLQAAELRTNCHGPDIKGVAHERNYESLRPRSGHIFFAFGWPSRRRLCSLGITLLRILGWLGYWQPDKSMIFTLSKVVPCHRARMAHVRHLTSTLLLCFSATVYNRIRLAAGILTS